DDSQGSRSNRPYGKAEATTVSEAAASAGRATTTATWRSARRSTALTYWLSLTRQLDEARGLQGRFRRKNPNAPFSRERRERAGAGRSQVAVTPDVGPGDGPIEHGATTPLYPFRVRFQPAFRSPFSAVQCAISPERCGDQIRLNVPARAARPS